LNVCHTCDVRDCVNPDHLFVGTQKANVADMIAKGRDFRGIPKTGADRHGSKLDAAKVAYIRANVGPRGSRTRVANDLGVSLSLVSMVASGKRWAGGR
jgi:hypothetical protein